MNSDFIEDFTTAIKRINNFTPNIGKGASETELLLIETNLQLSLPEDFKDFYRRYNGQSDVDDYLFDTFYLCTLKQVLTSWKALKDNEKDFADIKGEAER